jgi:hypothetical protein
MCLIVINKRDLIEYLSRYFDDSDNDNYARFIRNYPTVVEDFLLGGGRVALCQNAQRFV